MQTNPADHSILKYLLIVRNVTSFGPDGVSKPAMLINGTFPGPTIVASMS